MADRPTPPKPGPLPPEVPNASAAFLGPYGENDELLEKLVVEFLRDHVFWRRNFHPEDPPAIPTRARFSAEHQAFEARMRRELHALSAALKRSVPFHSPRYIGHMASDTLLPGLIAQIVTLPYNPNNVVEDAAPVTVELELEAGLMLARMLGFPSDPTRADCAFGHLTSGGSMANYEALAMLRAVRFWPLAVAAALRGRPVVGAAAAAMSRLPPLLQLDDWALANLTVAECIALRIEVGRALAALPDRNEAAALAAAIEGERIGALGTAEFHRRHHGLAPPVVLAPATAHYSWEKAMRLLGLGTDRLWQVGEKGMRMDADALEAALAQAHEQRVPVLAVVAVLGTTEFGTLDPLHRVVAARASWRKRGLGFGVHVDGAWGGYLASMFRRPDGGLVPRAEVRARFQHFPSQEVYDSIAALAEADSVTIDPHKLGYLPFGTGAIVYRDQRVTEFVVQDAAYVFDVSPVGAAAAAPSPVGAAAAAPSPVGAAAAATSGLPPLLQETPYRSRFRGLGRYILEGSKPGANAAAVYVAHKVMPLDAEHFGRIVAGTVRNAERFQHKLEALAERLKGKATLAIPFEPDSNLVCLALNPKPNRDLAVANRFTQRIYEALRVDASQPLQVKQHFASATTLELHSLGHAPMIEVLDRLGLDPRTLRESPQDPQREAAGLFVLRHTLMNPWLYDAENGIDYLDRYCDFLAALV
jgi:glutamate/tyrosine decarboxylase-like PLP-dependent enzyme